MAARDVCSYCTDAGACPKDTHFWAFRLPQLLGVYRDLPCNPPVDLGVDGALQPVTHVGGPRRGPTDSGGLWFYFARGCSDLLWDMGRTVLTRNRVHAAVVAEQRLALTMGQSLSDREAIGRVADYVRARHPKWPPLGRARSWAGLGKNASVEAIIAEAARGLYGTCNGMALSPEGRLRPCLCSGNVSRYTSLPSSQKRRLIHLAPLSGDKVLSLHSEPILRQLPIDTLTLYQQPQGGGSPLWTTEIWDLRGSPALSRHLENATSHPEVVARSRWAVSRNDASKLAAPCQPSATWHTCMACSGSLLESHCNATLQMYERKSSRGRA